MCNPSAARTSRSPGSAGATRQAARPLSWYVQALLIAAIVWGAFAFGAVYPWAYWPLAAAASTVAMLTLPASFAPSLHLKPLGLALALFAMATTFQLVPLPAEWLRSLSSRSLDVVTAFDLAAGAHPSRHAISIVPRLTATGLFLFASFSLLVLGSARLISLRGPRPLAHAIAIVGVLLAMGAIIQKSLFTGRIYGFWTPQTGGNPFGPFVNKNHFAGWMTMALPVTLGLLCGGIARGMRQVKPTFRDRLLWLSSTDASRLVLIAGAAAVMALSVVLTFSRSGIAATSFGLALIGVVAVCRQGRRTRGAMTTSYVVLLGVTVSAWVGVDTIIGLFANTDWSSFNQRRGAWADARAIASMFPLTGTGLNTYGVATLFYQQHDLAWHYGEAHNEYLQLAAEGGMLLTVPAVLCVAALAAVVWRRFREETSTSGYWVRVGALTGLAAIGLQSMVEFSLQMPGNAALFAVLCGIAIHRSPENTPR